MQQPKQDYAPPRHLDAVGRTLYERDEYRRLAVVAVTLLLVFAAIVIGGVGFALRAQAMSVTNPAPTREEVLASLYGKDQPTKGETIARLGHAYATPVTDRPSVDATKTPAVTSDDLDQDTTEPGLTAKVNQPAPVAKTDSAPTPSAQEASELDALNEVVTSGSETTPVVNLGEDGPEYWTFQLGDTLLGDGAILKPDGTKVYWHGAAVLHPNGVMHYNDPNLFGEDEEGNSWGVFVDTSETGEMSLGRYWMSGPSEEAMDDKFILSDPAPVEDAVVDADNTDVADEVTITDPAATDVDVDIDVDIDA